MKPDYQLIQFVNQLYELHPYTGYGFNNEAMARCQRWMDEVLPPEPRVIKSELSDKDTAPTKN
jgi:hypothetical protein